MIYITVSQYFFQSVVLPKKLTNYYLYIYGDPTPLIFIFKYSTTTLAENNMSLHDKEKTCFVCLETVESENSEVCEKKSRCTVCLCYAHDKCWVQYERFGNFRCPFCRRHILSTQDLSTFPEHVFLPVSLCVVFLVLTILIVIMIFDKRD